MRVRIGLSDTPREADRTRARRSRRVPRQSGKGHRRRQQAGWATDTEGQRYGVSAAKVAYVQVDAEKMRTVAATSRRRLQLARRRRSANQRLRKRRRSSSA